MVEVRKINDRGHGDYGWLLVLCGSVTVNATVWETSDRAVVCDEIELSSTANVETGFMMFDLR